ncbi:MAG: ribosome recycling factor [Bdellovibrionales bacterium]|jgi:ribosome recycling factor|nr:ribosome recycling factor [Bdellovibrionales bacterium]MBT3526501.1 ribosome recycling factor [Bdellovibrionales bacterium]MBT7670041.1 ribosome recycling factor [Bdellovibrionales bacterium]
MLEQIKSDLEEEMGKAIASLKKQLSRVRTGRATASVLDGVIVDYYGVATPVSQVGQISTPEARLMQIQPYDKSMITAIERAILGANLGITPSNDGNLIRIPFPALTEDRRKERVKETKKIGEDGKIAIRNIRRDENDLVKQEEKGKNISEDDSKRFQAEVQTITDRFISEVDVIINEKEQELLTV